MTLHRPPAGATRPPTEEQSDDRFTEIDTMSVDSLARAMNAEDSHVPGAVEQALPSIVLAIQAVIERLERGGRLIYVGAGTPGRIAVLDASECPPTFGTDPSEVFAIIAGGNAALVNAREGAEDNETEAVAAVADAKITERDAVIGIASSGRTPFVLAAIAEARRRGALTVGLSCSVNTALSAASELAIEVIVGPEIVSGSTRLKAGTAQKLVLNMFSTITMVALGHTYGNLMVDVRASNSKLRERAVRIVSQVANVDERRASTSLEVSGFNVKKSIVSLRLGLELEEAAALLDQHNGRLRSVLEADS